MGMIGLKMFAIKATALVLEVTKVALEALLKAYANLLLMSSFKSSIFLLYLQASTNTKISSAAIPNTIKMQSMCKLE